VYAFEGKAPFKGSKDGIQGSCCSRSSFRLVFRILEPQKSVNSTFSDDDDDDDDDDDEEEEEDSGGVAVLLNATVQCEYRVCGGRCERRR